MITYYVVYPGPDDNRLRAERIDFTEVAVRRVKELVGLGIEEDEILIAQDNEFSTADDFISKLED